MKRAARYIIFYAALFGLWALLAKLKIWPTYLFPTPWGVGEELYYGFADHSYWIAIIVSMKRVLLGYAVSVVLGMILGLGVASNKFLEQTMGGLLVSLQSLPSICWWPLALLWFGFNQNAILLSWSWDRCCLSPSPWRTGASRCRRFTAWLDATLARADSNCSGTCCCPPVFPISSPD